MVTINKTDFLQSLLMCFFRESYTARRLILEQIDNENATTI